MHIHTYGSPAVPVRAPALAAALTFANIQPHEYELPVDYQPFNLLVQYGWWNSSDTLAPNSALTVSWAKSLSGRNTGETNALYARFTYAF